MTLKKITNKRKLISFV